MIAATPNPEIPPKSTFTAVARAQGTAPPIVGLHRKDVKAEAKHPESARSELEVEVSKTGSQIINIIGSRGRI
jgi:hypothetical protein